MGESRIARFGEAAVADAAPTGVGCALGVRLSAIRWPASGRAMTVSGTSGVVDWFDSGCPAVTGVELRVVDTEGLLPAGFWGVPFNVDFTVSCSGVGAYAKRTCQTCISTIHK